MRARAPPLPGDAQGQESACPRRLVHPCASQNPSQQTASVEVDGASNNALPPQLPPALQLHVLSFLPPNDRALSGRLVSPDAADALTGPDHCTASLSQPLPSHAAPWAVGAGRQHVRQLSLNHKLGLLCTAAASGSEVNLEAVWTLLQPSVFPELLERYQNLWNPSSKPLADPGVAAVQAGHPQLLGWLVRHCPGQVNFGRVLQAVARHCDLAGLQATWRMLQTRSYRGRRVVLALAQRVLDAAAGGSGSGDAVAKMEWLMREGRASCSPDRNTAAAAARSGDLGRLRWLRDRGCPMDREGVLESALRHADLTVAQWLVDKARCRLPAAGNTREWHMLLMAAVSAQDALAKLQWLGERGAQPLHRAGEVRLAELARAAAAAGCVDVLQHLRSLPGLTPEQDRGLLLAAFTSPCAVKSIPMLEHLRRAGVELTPSTFSKVAGSLDTVRWLARQVSSRPSTDDLTRLILKWPHDAPSHSRDLLQGVQLLVGQMGFTDWGVPQWQKEQVVYAAARRGDLALVQYLLQQLPGYQPGGKVLVAAAEGGCEALLEWLVEQHPGCLEGPWGMPAYVTPAKVGDRGTLAALRRLRVPWGAGDVVVQAVREGAEAPALRWLVEQGAPVGGAGAMEAAVGRSECLSAEDGAWLRGLATANGAQALVV